MQNKRTVRRVGELRVCRGGIPVHEALCYGRGKSYIHSTDIFNLVVSKSGNRRKKVKSSHRGIVKGWVILLPRVGVPCFDSMVPVFLREDNQLSDCVIALKFKSKRQAILCSEVVQGKWKGFLENYRGTGARYTTVDKLCTWLDKNGWSAVVE